MANWTLMQPKETDWTNRYWMWLIDKKNDVYHHFLSGANLLILSNAKEDGNDVLRSSEQISFAKVWVVS